ncbi:MAG: SIMPL domain-containing protein, partial [Zoogloeaceae bacterium]|nr:SIMPL domain-containing protein [Zoogloeaceae bacterium]
GFGASAFILGGKFRTIGDNTQKIVVKGLAEKPVEADLAEWSVGISLVGKDFGTTLDAIRQSRPVLEAFLDQHGFPASTRVTGNEQVEPNMVDDEKSERYRRVQKGYRGTQVIRVRSDDLQKIVAANKEIIQLAAEGKPIMYETPNYLIQDLEAIKMSLIGAATENARQRAEEFAKVGKVRVDAMRSASQGAFYIQPANSDASSDDYGGVYDKSTIAKKARVVVTIEYGID